MNKRNFLFIVSTRAFLLSHRIEIVERLLQQGHTVSILTGSAGNPEMEFIATQKLSRMNLKLITIKTHSYYSLLSFFNIFLIFRQVKPDIIHIVTLKMYLLTGISLLYVRKARLVVALSGLGYLGVLRNTPFSWLKRQALEYLIKFYLLMKKNTCVIVQNATDQDLILGLASNSTVVVLIPGSGVNFEEFRFKKYKMKSNTVIFSGRILRDKGIVEFVEACRILHQEFPDWQFLVLGTADYANPTALSKKQFLSLISGTPIKWLGYVSDPKKIIRNAKIMCLPSYREGLSKVLIEAAATGSCIVTTNVPGCRDVVVHKKNGFLAEVYSVQDLVSSLREAMSNDVFSEKMAKNAFNDAISRFSIEQIVNQNLDCYFTGQFNE